jgi:hypothetical protein
MRNRIPFGYTVFAGKTLVKINVKISTKQAVDLVQKYPGLVQWDNGKYGKALEGVLNYDAVEKFVKELELVKIDAKIEALIDKKTKILDEVITDNDFPNFDLR